MSDIKDIGVTSNTFKQLPKVYYCEKCDRYTDIHYLFDKGKGHRLKSYCYKCSEEMLIPVSVSIRK